MQFIHYIIPVSVDIRRIEEFVVVQDPLGKNCAPEWREGKAFASATNSTWNVDMHSIILNTAAVYNGTHFIPDICRRPVHVRWRNTTREASVDLTASMCNDIFCGRGRARVGGQVLVRLPYAFSGAGPHTELPLQPLLCLVCIHIREEMRHGFSDTCE